MKSCNTKIKLCALLLTPLMIVSCDSAVETGSQTDATNPDPVVTSSKPTVALSTEQVNANVGDVFTVDITMKNFPVSEGGGVTIKFDASMLNASDVSISTGWNFVNKVGNIDNNAGVISDILFSSYQGVDGDNLIATITFSAIASGSSQIMLEGSAINPFASNGDKIAASFTNTNVVIN